MYGEHCTLAVCGVTEYFELFAFGIGTFHFSEQKKVHINVSEGGQFHIVYVNKGQVVSELFMFVYQGQVGGQKLAKICLRNY